MLSIDFLFLDLDCLLVYKTERFSTIMETFYVNKKGKERQRIAIRRL